MTQVAPGAPKNDLFRYMQEVTATMQSEYDRIRARSHEDPGTAGDNGEENWAKVLRDWVPESYPVVTKGRIMNTEGECSPQVDVLILSPSYPRGLLKKKEYLEAGVVAAFECKLSLRSRDIRDVVETAKAIRRLSKKPQLGTPARELRHHIHFGLLAHSQAVKSDDALSTITERLVAADLACVESPAQMMDWLCISDLALWTQNALFVTAADLLGFPERYAVLGKELDKLVQAGGAIETAYMVGAAHEQPAETVRRSFTPIGSFLASLLTRMAWGDPLLRAMAEYFVLSGVLGAARGQTRIWPVSVLSGQLVAKLRAGHEFMAGGGGPDWRWNEWSKYLM